MKKDGMMVKMMMALVMMAAFQISGIGAASAMANSDLSGKSSQDKAAVQTQAQSQTMREIVRVR